jgi:hypothetical protein
MLLNYMPTESMMLAMHEERLARASRKALLIEAKRASTGKRPGRASASRERIAQGLVALAKRIAPAVTAPRTETGMLTR